MRDRIKHLGTGVAIYGAGDAAIQIVNFFLIAIYVKSNFLTMTDFGALALIGTIEAYAKVINRWGLDGAFMRFYHEREEGPARQRMASTIVWFMLAANGLILAGALAWSAALGRAMALDPRYLLALRLMLINMFLMAFTFLPFHAMRMRHQPAMFSLFSLARSAGSIVFRIALVIGLRMGITGVYATDLIITVVLLPLMASWFVPLVRAVFSVEELRAVLRFGLPRLPHGLASQTLDGNPKLMLGQYVAASEVGVYQNGVTLGTGVSFFKNALETAFAPFYYATARQADAKVVFSKMATYGLAVFVLLVAGTTAVAREVILLLLKPEYLDALPVVPLVAIAFAFQGVYQLTSIGLNLTGRTEFYPVATITAALVSVGAGLVLIPRYHVTGAAITVLVSYGTQVGVAFVLTQRLYRIEYEVGRVVRILVAGVAATLAALWLPLPPSPIVGLLVRGSVTTVAFVGLMWATGFFRPTERAFIREMTQRLRQRTPWAAAAASDAD